MHRETVWPLVVQEKLSDPKEQLVLFFKLLLCSQRLSLVSLGSYRQSIQCTWIWTRYHYFNPHDTITPIL